MQNPITTSNSTVPVVEVRETDSYSRVVSPRVVSRIAITGARRPPNKRSVAIPARNDPAAAPTAITQYFRPAFPIVVCWTSIRCFSPQSRKP